MDSIAQLAATKGYPILALLVFLEAIGFPIPASIAMLIAGGTSVRGPLSLGQVIAVSTGALLAGDLIMYTLGRLTGWWLLGVLCRLSLNPESCILNSADSFYKRGRSVLVVAKFLPGISTMSTPLAGSMNIPLSQFLALDLAGALLYVCVYSVAGYVFSDFLSVIQRGVSTVGSALGIVIAVGVVAWIGNRLRLWLKSRKGEPVELVHPHEIQDWDAVEILDVRSHGYYDSGSLRIKGSRRLEPNALQCQASTVARDKDVVLYCTCVKEATAVHVARGLRNRGIGVKVLAGGLRAWQKAGMPVEPVPVGEVVPLPKFS